MSYAGSSAHAGSGRRLPSTIRDAVQRTNMVATREVETTTL
jgi:hypothetical protein